MDLRRHGGGEIQAKAEDRRRQDALGVKGAEELEDGPEHDVVDGRVEPVRVERFGEPGDPYRVRHLGIFGYHVGCVENARLVEIEGPLAEQGIDHDQEPHEQDERGKKPRPC